MTDRNWGNYSRILHCMERGQFLIWYDNDERCGVNYTIEYGDYMRSAVNVGQDGESDLSATWCFV